MYHYRANALLTLLLLVANYSYSQTINIPDPILSRISSEASGASIQESITNLFYNLQLSDESEYLKNVSDSELTLEVFNTISSIYDSDDTIQTTLLNYHRLSKDIFKIQVGLFSPRNDRTNTPLESIIELLGHNENKQIKYSTPLSINTRAWYQNKIGKVTYHYKSSINHSIAKQFANNNELFASKFELPSEELDFYIVANYQEILELIGIEYNKGQISTLRDGYGVVDNTIFSIMSNEDFSHDLFHFYSGKVHETKERNWVAEEGIAYSWGNAYYTHSTSGAMIEQESMVQILKEYLASNPNTNLLELFKKNFWTDTSGVLNDLAPDISIGRLISSLLCDAVERRHGMEGINAIISCGRAPDSFTTYLEQMSALIGISASNFEEELLQLLESYE